MCHRWPCGLGDRGNRDRQTLGTDIHVQLLGVPESSQRSQAGDAAEGAARLAETSSSGEVTPGLRSEGCEGASRGKPRVSSERLRGGGAASEKELDAQSRPPRTRPAGGHSAPAPRTSPNALDLFCRQEHGKPASRRGPRRAKTLLSARPMAGLLARWLPLTTT